MNGSISAANTLLVTRTVSSGPSARAGALSSIAVLPVPPPVEVFGALPIVRLWPAFDGSLREYAYALSARAVIRILLLSQRLELVLREPSPNVTR